MDQIHQIQQLIHHPWWQYLWPPAAGVVVFFFGFALRSLLLSRLQRWAARSRWAWSDILLQAIRGPFILWCIIVASYVTVAGWPVSARLDDLARKGLSILWLFSLTFVAVRVTDQLIQRYGAKLSTALPLTSLTQNLTKATILVIGTLMMLNSLGVSITPILTALGVGGLAVALALQETLSNLFAGIYITVARQIRVRDYVKLDSGEEGHVSDIAWRNTRICSLSNNLIVIPNTKLAQAIVTNYDLPSQDMAVLVEVSVDYRSDLEKVEKVTSEVAKEIMREVPGGVPAFEPFIRYHTFGSSSINFTVILRGKAYVDQYLIKHEFIKRLHRRYAQEGITIPFPIQTVILQPQPSAG